MTSVEASLYKDHVDMAVWLILQGATNTNSHVDQGVIAAHVKALKRTTVAASLQLLVAAHGVIFETVLFGVAAFSPVLAHTESAERDPKKRCTTGKCALRKLRGNESTIVANIAGFAAVITGRQLRIAREVLCALGF